VRIHEDAAGCWIDGSRGIYATSRLVEIALDYPGFLKGRSRYETIRNRREARLIHDAYNAGEDTVKYRQRPKYSAAFTVTIEDVSEQLGGLAEQAEDFLNTIAPEGYSFGWHDGDFFMQSGEWWDEEAA
jgi:hypothetical protein